MKSFEKLAKQKTYTREDLLVILEKISMRVNEASYSRVLDAKEALGYDRDDEPKD